MLLEKELKKILRELIDADETSIYLRGSTIAIKVFDKAKKIFLATPVYFGGNFIPKSVRKCLKDTPPFDDLIIRAIPKIDEENFQVLLNYNGSIENMNKQKFIDLLEEFSLLADKWRDFLDEHDRNDLIHIAPNR